MNDLESRIAGVETRRPVLEAALNRIVKDVGELEFIVSMHYSLESNVLSMVIIHDMGDRIRAMKEYYRKFQPVEVAFSDLYFREVILHKDEILPSSLSGTTPFFVKR